MSVFTRVLACLILAFSGPAIAGEAAGKPLRILTVGNSFANDATAYLPAMAKASGRNLVLLRANLGGCSLERHVHHLQAFEANSTDPEGRPYRAGLVRSSGDTSPPALGAGGNDTAEPPRFISLKEALESERWDFVTIQQVSTESFKSGSFEPYAGILIGYIHKYAPSAEILVHQTWAYREDCPLFQNGFTQQKMFEGLKSAYGMLAEKYHLRVIPVGTAIQQARKLPRWTFSWPDPKFDYKNPAPGTKPDQKGSLSVGWMVSKDKAHPVASLDFKHCNVEGRYLAASVFYAFLFGDNAADNTFLPGGLDPKDAEILRGIADNVLGRRPAAAVR